jgi:hypothetical protein
MQVTQSKNFTVRRIDATNTERFDCRNTFLGYRGTMTGCRAEDARLRTALRLTNLLAVFCILSWRVFWLTMTNRIDPEADPELVFTDLELRILERLVADKPTAQLRQSLLSHYLVKLARLGGYRARNSDPPPGNETIWRGLTRLVDIQLGVIMGAQLVGN